MTEIVIETVRALIVTGIFCYFFYLRRKRNLTEQKGLLYVIIGFGLLSFGMLIDITDNFESLNYLVVVGDTPVQSFLEKVVGILIGFGFLSIGFWLWLPGIIELRDTKEKLADANLNLENKVKERTSELEESLDIVSNLKHQQDADYFLTSLLIRPLELNRNYSDIVSIETLIRQKKQFTYKKWDTEIGGDTCICSNIELRGRPYTAIVNADAMGKSIQGAGGILVLAALINAFINRTKTVRSEFGGIFPEAWLYKCYLELQSVFEAFDGSMYVSGFIGIIDDWSGLLFFINAEHPRTVFNRDRKASFIEPGMTLRKIGMPEGAKDFAIMTLQLKSGDVVIAGSDGRDDLILAESEDGLKVNEDEHMFLTNVEKADAGLEALVEAIDGTGKSMDDLSLLRVEYSSEPRDRRRMTKTEKGRYDEIQMLKAKGDHKAAVTVARKAFELNDNVIFQKEIAAIEYKLTHTETALVAVEQYLQRFPHDLSAIALASFCFKRLGRYSEAADYGERYRLRRPEDQAMLDNLSQIYKAIRRQNQNGGAIKT